MLQIHKHLRHWDENVSTVDTTTVAIGQSRDKFYDAC